MYLVVCVEFTVMEQYKTFVNNSKNINPVVNVEFTMMEQYKTFVNTSEYIHPIVYVEFTMDCKVICGFDLSLVKRFTDCIFLLLESTEKIDVELLWFGISPGVFGKDDLRGWVQKLHLLSTVVFDLCKLS